MSLLGFALAMAFLSSVPKSDQNDSSSERSEEVIFSISDNMTEELWRMFYSTLG